MENELIPTPPEMSPLEKVLVVSTAAGAIAGVGIFGYVATGEQGAFCKDLPLSLEYFCRGAHTAYALIAGAVANFIGGLI